MIPQTTLLRLNAIATSLHGLKNALETDELKEEHIDWLETDVRGLESLSMELQDIYYAKED